MIRFAGNTINLSSIVEHLGHLAALVKSLKNETNITRKTCKEQLGFQR
jgi:hypothetical protein